LGCLPQGRPGFDLGLNRPQVSQTLGVGKIVYKIGLEGELSSEAPVVCHAGGAEFFQAAENFTKEKSRAPRRFSCTQGRGTLVLFISSFFRGFLNNHWG
jgi:hypothetical protein